MNRLTIPNWDYNDMSLGTIGPCLARLSAYEDIGLEPEQLRDMMTAPVVRCKDCTVPHNRWTGCPKLNGLITPDDFYCAFGK